jgi:acetyl-CoA carboxylase carboxyltransferase component/biotin carboxyl carrier protein
VQVVADDHGGVTHLWERDCSLQRRHQKLIEIAPAPGLSPALRGALIDAATRLAKSSQYSGVGTFEFLVPAQSPSGTPEFYFMECNPRLQVEHTVTEEVTGVDLVETQLRLAEGASLADLGLADGPPAPRGYSVQLRVLAEETTFRPAVAAAAGSGLEPLSELGAKPSCEALDVWVLPSGGGVRVDHATALGLVVGHPAFDSLLAKLVVTCHAPPGTITTTSSGPTSGNRGVSDICYSDGESSAGRLGTDGVASRLHLERTLRRASSALAAFKIGGPATNVPLLGALLALPEVLAAGATTTSFVEGHAAALWAKAVELQQEAAKAASRGAASGVEDGEQPVEAASASGRGGEGSLVVPAGSAAVGSPVLGTVLSVTADVGEAVASGQVLALVESMKMEVPVVAPCEGVVAAAAASVGRLVGEGEALFAVTPTLDEEKGGVAGATAAQAARLGGRGLPADCLDLNAVRPDLAALRGRLALLGDGARPAAVARRRGRGQLTARESIALLTGDLTGDVTGDSGEGFAEYGGLAHAAMRSARPVEDLRAATPADGIVTGVASVNAHLGPHRSSSSPSSGQGGASCFRCAVLAVDATVLAGTQGYFHHKKIDRLLEVARQASLPVVFFPEGGGGRPNDVDLALLSASGLSIKSWATYAKLAGVVPRVAVVSGFCFAGSAAFAGLSDVVIASASASLGMGGPAMIEGGGLGVVAPADVGPVPALAATGAVDLVAPDDVAAVALAQQYLAFFQVRQLSAPSSGTGAFACADQRRLRVAIPENPRRAYDVRASVLDVLFDAGSVLELRRAFGGAAVTCLARLEGRAVGVIASDPMRGGGAIDDEAAEKLARFLRLCDAFGLPVVSLCDTPGFMVGPAVERKGLVRKAGRLFLAGAGLRVPLVCVVTRKATGLGAMAMAGGSTASPVDMVSWPSGEFSGMGVEGAVRLGCKKELAALAADPVAQAARFDELVGAMRASGQATSAAAFLELDAVIDPAHTRKRITQSLASFSATAPTNTHRSGALLDVL